MPAPLFQHRHYRKIAEIIASMRGMPNVVGSSDAIANHFANALYGTNPNFDRGRFLSAATGEPSNGRDGHRRQSSREFRVDDIVAPDFDSAVCRDAIWWRSLQDNYPAWTPATRFRVVRVFPDDSCGPTMQVESVGGDWTRGIERNGIETWQQRAFVRAAPINAGIEVDDES